MHASEPYKASHGSVASAWNTVAAELSSLEIFEQYGGVKPEGCKKKFEVVMAEYKVLDRSAPYRSGDAEEAGEVRDIACIGAWCATIFVCACESARTAARGHEHATC